MSEEKQDVQWRFERARIAYLESETEWLHRLLRWARARLSNVSQQMKLDQYLALGRSSPAPQDEPAGAASGIALSPSKGFWRADYGNARW